jgi:hypothetical protein
MSTAPLVMHYRSDEIAIDVAGRVNCHFLPSISFMRRRSPKETPAPLNDLSDPPNIGSASRDGSCASANDVAATDVVVANEITRLRMTARDNNAIFYLRT